MTRIQLNPLPLVWSLAFHGVLPAAVAWFVLMFTFPSVLYGFLVVTLGPSTMEQVVGVQQLLALERLFIAVGPFLPGGTAVVACLFGGAALWYSRAVRGDLSRAIVRVLFWVSLLVGAALLAYSYRFLGLIAVPIAIWSYTQGLRGLTPARRVVAAWALAAVVSLLPFDLSFQSVSAAPHFAPTVSGLLSHDGQARVQAGEYVVVGGCTPMFYEPTWVWVW